ncbi:unnamed protein product, partial [Orchesella dallaii]
FLPKKPFYKKYLHNILWNPDLSKPRIPYLANFGKFSKNSLSVPASIVCVCEMLLTPLICLRVSAGEIRHSLITLSLIEI